MSGDQPIDIVLAVVSFDGRVLEVFGRRDADRIHVAEITSIKEDDANYVIATRSQIQHEVRLNEGDEDKRGEIESLIDAVRGASPNLEEAQ